MFGARSIHTVQTTKKKKTCEKQEWMAKADNISSGSSSSSSNRNNNKLHEIKLMARNGDLAQHEYLIFFAQRTKRLLTVSSRLRCGFFFRFIYSFKFKFKLFSSLIFNELSSISGNEYVSERVSRFGHWFGLRRNIVRLDVSSINRRIEIDEWSMCFIFEIEFFACFRWMNMVEWADAFVIWTWPDEWHEPSFCYFVCFILVYRTLGEKKIIIIRITWDACVHRRDQTEKREQTFSGICPDPRIHMYAVDKCEIWIVPANRCRWSEPKMEINFPRSRWTARNNCTYQFLSCGILIMWN